MARNRNSNVSSDDQLLASKSRDERLVERRSIIDILNTSYSSIAVDASTNPESDSIDALVNLLETDKAFREYSVHGDHEAARRFVDEYLGAGLIPKILKEYPATTDISYNGRFMTVATNDRKFIYARSGREDDGMDGVTKPDGSPLDIVDDDYIRGLITRFANRLNKQFNETNPQFNGFIDSFRVSATDKSLSPVGYTMSLRISRASKALNRDNFNQFAPLKVLDLLHNLVKAHNNIIISGETGTGKTELLKLLLEPVPFRDKIIMIEDVAETHLPELYPEKDIFDWLTSVSESHDGSGRVSGISIEDHVKNALRNQPNWLLVSETRGGEAADMFDSVLSGHNIITTLHAISNEAVPDRFVGMVLQSASGANRPMEDLKNSFYRYMGFGIHIRREIFTNGKILRYLQELVHYSFDTLDDPEFRGVVPIFRQEIEQVNDDEVIRRFKRWPLEDSVSKQIRLANKLTPSEMLRLWTPTAKIGKDENGKAVLLKTDDGKFVLTDVEEKLEV